MYIRFGERGIGCFGWGNFYFCIVCLDFSFCEIERLVDVIVGDGCDVLNKVGFFV